MRFRNSEQVLAVLPGENNRLTTYMDDSMNMFYDYVLEADYQWSVIPAENGVYYLVLDGLALTYDKDNNLVCLEEYAQKDTQKWLIK